MVRPRQIGMYLAKHLTSRSLPEIGRRFGNRDHTTVLHAIRKIDKEVRRESAPQGRDRGAEAPAQPLAGWQPKASNPSARGFVGGGCSGEERRRKRRSCSFCVRAIPGKAAAALAKRGVAVHPCRAWRISSADPRVSRFRRRFGTAAPSVHLRPREGSNRRGRDEAGDRTR